MTIFPVLTPIVGGVAYPTVGEGMGVRGALSPTKAVLMSQSADVNWVALGDSTSSGTTSWLYLFFVWLSTQYPAFTFVYYPPDAAGGYGAPVTLTTGSGSRTFRFYNNSIDGTTPQTLMGSLFTGAFVTPGRTWDAVIWNHGKNMVTGVGQEICEGEMLAAVAQVQLAFPAANHIVSDQYPNRDDANMALAHTCWTDVVLSTQISIIDLYGRAGLVAGDYTDNAHANATGNTTKLLPVAQAYWNATVAGAWTAEPPWLSITGINLLDGNSSEDYANFALNGTTGTVPGAAAGGPPAGFTSGGGGTVIYAQETTITYGGAARSQKTTPAVAPACSMNRTLASGGFNALKGQTAVLTAIEYIASGGASTMGSLGIATNGTGGVGNKTTRSTTEGQGGWKVKCLGPMFVPSDASFVIIPLYVDSAASPDTTHSVYFQWANLALGRKPRQPN